MWQKEFKGFEGLDENGKIGRLGDILVKQGCRYLGYKKSRARVENYHYLSVDGKYVTTIVINKAGKMLACVYNYCSYEKYFKDGGLVLSLNDRGEGKCIEPSLNGKEYPFNVRAYRVILVDDPSGKLPEGYEVDHITHTHCDMTLEGLRKCTRCQNSMNKSCRVSIKGDTITCRVKEIPGDKKAVLLDLGYLIEEKESRYEVMKSGCGDIRASIEELETALFGEFRYNPLMDFSRTWYALILWKMFGIPEDEVMAYQKGYLLDHRGDVCAYYGIAD